MTSKFVLYADHFQVLAGDREEGPLVDTTSLWDSADSVASLSDQDTIVGIATVRFGGSTNFEIEIATQPPVDPADWKRLGEFTLRAPSGEILFWGPESPDPAAQGTRVQLPSPGTYKGIAYSFGAEQVTDEMAPSGPDTYRVVLWRSP